MRKVMISSAAAAAAIAATLAGAGPAAATGTPQSPQSQTILVECPNMEPFIATSPTPPSRVGLGQVVTVIPEGIFLGQMPDRLFMHCTLTFEPNGPTLYDIPILIAPTTR
jgi:hypothetical protein